MHFVENSRFLRSTARHLLLHVWSVYLVQNHRTNKNLPINETLLIAQSRFNPEADALLSACLWSQETARVQERWFQSA